MQLLLSASLIETLTDLVRIKPSCLDVFGREDVHEKACFENTLRELAAGAFLAE